MTVSLKKDVVSLEVEPLNKDSAEKQSEEPKKFEWEKYLRYVSLVVLVIQNTGQVLLMRYATRREQQQFLKTVAVFFNEVVKLIASTILFTVSTGSVTESLRLLKHHFITNFVDTLKVGVPSLIYTLQNFLLYVAIEHLDAATFMVTYQLKILTTALFTVVLLRRRLSLVQWIALFILTAGVAAVQISAGKGSPKAVETLNATTMASITNAENAPALQKPWMGLSAVLMACVMSGFAGIYFEKILKGSDVSIWLRNVQLAALAVPISLIVIAIKDNERISTGGFMQGFDLIVWCVIALQALGGLVVAVVIKYADNILKAFATSISIVVASAASAFLFAVIPKPLFLLGAILVIGAVVLYGTFPYRSPPKNDDPEDPKEKFIEEETTKPLIEKTEQNEDQPTELSEDKTANSKNNQPTEPEEEKAPKSEPKPTEPTEEPPTDPETAKPPEVTENNENPQKPTEEPAIQNEEPKP